MALIQHVARDLTIRGTTKMGASASGKINRQDFGVKYHEVMDNGGLGVADVSSKTTSS